MGSLGIRGESDDVRTSKRSRCHATVTCDVFGIRGESYDVRDSKRSLGIRGESDDVRASKRSRCHATAACDDAPDRPTVDSVHSNPHLRQVQTDGGGGYQSRADIEFRSLLLTR